MKNEHENPPHSPASGIEFRELLQVFLEKWWLLFLTAAACGALGYYYITQRPPFYTVKSVLEVQQEDPQLFGIDDIAHQDLRTSEMLNTIVANIENSSVLRRVILTNQLLRNPAFLANTVAPVDEEQAIKILSSIVSCSLRKDTRLIDIKVTHSDPRIAQTLANSLAQEFIRQILDQRFSTARVANDLLSDEAAKLKAQLAASEKALQDYKQEKMAASLEQDQNIVIDTLKEINKAYTDANTIRLQLEAEVNQLRNFSNNPEALLSLPSVLLQPAVADLHQKVIAMEAQVQTLAQRYKPKHPKMSLASQELHDLRAALNRTVLAYPHSIQSAYEMALAREKQLENALNESQQQALELDRNAIQYHVLLREVQSDRLLYEAVLKKLKETDIIKGWERQSVALVEPAILPTHPSGPSNTIIGAIAGFTGFFAMLGLLYVSRKNRDCILALDQAEAVLGLPVVAAIPKNRARKSKSRLVLAADPNSQTAEAFRALRTSTYLAGGPESRQIALFTSAVPGEGKTFCSVNYALALAIEGHRTLLMDMDLRRPSVAENFAISPKALGLGDYLQGKGKLSELIKGTEHPNLFVLPSGSPVTPECLSIDSLRKLLGDARQFTHIVIDSAPINAVSDTLLLLGEARFRFMVVRAGKTARRAALRAIEMMERAQHPPFGVILNFVPRGAGHGYYYHYSPDYDYKNTRQPKPAALPQPARS
jgi:polysaccharide biosynthesis transport protein